MRTLMISALVFGTVFPALAGDLPITNAGFEQLVLACAPGRLCATEPPWTLPPTAIVPGWTATGAVWTFKPSTGSGGIFPGGVPDGLNVLALGGMCAPGNDFCNGTVVQTLIAALEANTTYTLVFNVGTRADINSAGYSVELLVGSKSLASESSLSPSRGTFATGRLVYSSSANPELLGQRLAIRITGQAGGQVSFDKLSLDATPSIVTSSAAHIASGGGWKTTLTVVNVSSTQNSVRVAMWGNDGRPLTLPLLVTLRGASQAAMSSSVERTMEPGATLLIESEASATSATLVGWAEVIGSAPVEGFAIFRSRGQDGRDAEGTAPLVRSKSSGLMLPFDNTAGFATGVALVNWTSRAVIINAAIRDENGAQLDLKAVALPAMGHTSFAVADQFSITSGRRGFIDFQNADGGAMTGLGLRFSQSGSFTSVPAVAR